MAKIKNVILETDHILINRHFTDLNPILFGHHHCPAGHTYGPAVRKYVLIHHVIKGKGIVIKEKQTYRVGAGEAFLILPGEVVTYSADLNDPWYYEWVGFDGALSAKFAELPTVIPFSSGVIQEMISLADIPMREYRVAGLLFRLYAELFETKSTRHHYVRRVQDHIHALYMQPLRVEEIAEKMNLDRRYLSRLFKQKTGQTIQDYIVSVRMEEAKSKLLQGFSVEEAAQLCGYEDASNFSKMFKRRFGVSPLYWKNGQH